MAAAIDAGAQPPQPQRPQLTLNLNPAEFSAWYWLKEELVIFAREHGISTAGLKRELAARIRTRLAGSTTASLRQPPARNPARRTAASMPLTFHSEMRIGPNWRCGPRLGAYFREQLGPGFRFNASMRDFIHNGEGRTLLEAELCYQQSVGPGRASTPIPEQLEYNRHFRAYFAAHPSATRQEAIAAWWTLRNTRRPNPGDTE